MLIAPPDNHDDDDALNRRILLSTLGLEQRLENILSSSPSPCLKRPEGSCFVISPLAFWNYDEDTLRSDANILDVLTHTKNTTISEVVITPDMVLGGRGSDEQYVTSSRIDYASHLAVTYFFPEKDCVDDTGHQQWIEAVRTAASKIAKVSGHSHSPSIIALEVCTNILFSGSIPISIHSMTLAAHKTKDGRHYQHSYILLTLGSSPMLPGQ
jgi:hypothetical protein